jgi:hypothetical protein
MRISILLNRTFVPHSLSGLLAILFQTKVAYIVELEVVIVERFS